MMCKERIQCILLLNKMNENPEMTKKLIVEGKQNEQRKKRS